MRTHNSSFLTFILAMSMAVTAADWKKETTKDGKVTVEYSVSSRTNDQGDELPLVEYRATTVQAANFEKCLGVLKNVSLHKEIHDDENSQLVKSVSDSESIVYYFLKMPWPLPKADAVLRMTISRDSSAKTATVHLLAAPSNYPKKDARRFSIYDITYSLKDLGGGQVEITSRAKSSPPIGIPQWMIRASFPEAAADPVRNIAKLARKQ